MCREVQVRYDVIGWKAEGLLLMIFFKYFRWHLAPARSIKDEINKTDVIKAIISHYRVDESAKKGKQNMF